MQFGKAGGIRIISKTIYHLGLVQIVNADIYKNYKNFHSDYTEYKNNIRELRI